jgi:hypothetical protein
MSPVKVVFSVPTRRGVDRAINETTAAIGFSSLDAATRSIAW